MKNPIDVIRSKEQEITRVRKEIDALRIAAQLLGEDTQSPKTQTSEVRRAQEVQ